MGNRRDAALALLSISAASPGLGSFARAPTIQIAAKPSRTAHKTVKVVPFQLPDNPLSTTIYLADRLGYSTGTSTRPNYVGKDCRQIIPLVGMAASVLPRMVPLVIFGHFAAGAAMKA